jgi:dihydrofolate synthase / folylpolyglutamate synthase
MDSLIERGMNRGLDRVKQAAALLDNPQDGLKVIHIAGTNGKGSTCTFIAELLAQSGYRVGLMLSPHVDDYRERIQIASAESSLHQIGEGELLAMHVHLRKTVGDKVPLTYYEWTTLLALQFFSMQKLDFVVLETGLGGRWDASNICPSIVSGITTVGLDHMDILGGTVEKILAEKLQIVKPDSDFIFGPKDESLITQAVDHADQVGAHLHAVKSFSVIPAEAEIQQLPPYLYKNLQFALTVGEVLKTKGYKIKDQEFLSKPMNGIPARFEIIHENPLIILDGAHNEPALKELKKYLSETYNDDYDLVFGCLKTRDFLALSDIIVSKHENHWARFDAQNQTHDDQEYQRLREKHGGKIIDLNKDAVNELLCQKSKRPIVVCGSFYLCSDFRRFL